MNDYKQIRQRYLNGESQRSIAKSMGISRNTVKKYCEGEKVPWERKTPEREASVLTKDVLAFITSCLEEDEAEGLKKQRHTARRIYDRLVEEKGFEGGEFYNHYKKLVNYRKSLSEERDYNGVN